MSTLEETFSERLYKKNIRKNADGQKKGLSGNGQPLNSKNLLN
jgi:hypothetical protein